MSTNGSSFNYHYGPKNNWRRWAWNRIVERLPKLVKPKDAIVLYLAGEFDLDRDIALSKGFSEHNLIAVDWSDAVVKSLRQSRKLAIHGSLLEVVNGWSGQNVNVLFADFCSGLTLEPMKLLRDLGINDWFRYCVCCFNLMRGRTRRAINFADTSIAEMLLLGSIATSWRIMDTTARLRISAKESVQRTQGISGVRR